MTISVVYRGDVNSPSGYSRAIRNHMRALLEQGVEVYAEPHKHDSTDAPLDDFWKAHMPQILQTPHKKPRIKIWHETPEFYDPRPEYYNIAYVVWETDRLPRLGNNPRLDWVRQMNRMDEVWTSAESCRKAFVDSGVEVPIRIFPHPIDLSVYKPDGKSHTFRLGPFGSGDKLHALSVFQWSKRKNPSDLILGFTSQFPFDSDVALLLKTYGSDFGQGEALIQRIKAIRQAANTKGLAPNVFPMLDLVPDKEMPDLYRSSQLYIGVPYGEGFGMPFQEAMACGVPCIYPKGQGMDDFIDGSCGYPVETDPEPVYGMIHIPWYTIDQRWRSPRIHSLMAQLDRAYQDWQSGKLKEKGKRARKKIEKLHSMSTVGGACYERLEEIMAELESKSTAPFGKTTATL